MEASVQYSSLRDLGFLHRFLRLGGVITPWILESPLSKKAGGNGKGHRILEKEELCHDSEEGKRFWSDRYLLPASEEKNKSSLEL